MLYWEERRGAQVIRFKKKKKVKSDFERTEKNPEPVSGPKKRTSVKGFFRFIINADLG